MYKYFTKEELTCKHCEEYSMSDEFMKKLDQLREDMGFPFKITSAYRCPEHPIEARKKAHGAHTTGRAVDIAVQGEKAYRLIEGAIELKFKGIGIKQKGQGRFIHLDDIPNSPDRPRPWIWSY
mgnify:CR=1 FL=1